MPEVEFLDGEVVRLWFRLAADALGAARSAIDTLNVFPVPDADTGTNLHRTVACAADAVAALPNRTEAAEVWQAAATAALLGACGNSGIMLSQMLLGLAEICGPASPCDGPVVAVALDRAAAAARAAVHRPVEGTLLTVADAAARAAALANGLAEVGRAAALGARQALAATRDQLDVLAACGVVDAGGAGLCVVLDALSAAISGSGPVSAEVPAPAGRDRQARPADSAVPAAPRTGPFGYEVTYLLDAPEPALADLRSRLGDLGDSLVVSGGAMVWHVHVHVDDPGAAIDAGLEAGRPSKVTVTYLNEAPSPARATRPAGPGAVVVIADGAGLCELLAGAGATVIAAEPAAAQAAALDTVSASAGPAVLIAQPGPLISRWPAGWPVIEIGCPAQSLAALAVHDPGRDQAGDVAAMRRAAAGMRWASLAASDAAASAGQEAAAIALVAMLLGQGTDQAGTAMADIEMLTLITGRQAVPGLAEAITRHVASVAPEVEVICYDGGMTSAVLLIGAE